MAIRMLDPRNVSVLLVEDNPDNLFVFSDILRGDVGVGYCNARASGRQLLKFLADHPDSKPDLILLDLALPHEDGFKVLQHLHEFFDATNQPCPRIVALTANCLPETLARARREGFDGFIGKPIERSRFVRQIHQILRGEPVWEPA
ncbi:MAG TPA: response regulator [Herpetosiphonaceae bacterium]